MAAALKPGFLLQQLLGFPLLLMQAALTTVPVIVVLSVALVARVSPATPSQELPLLVNPHPVGAPEIAARLRSRVSEGLASADEKAELIQAGGALLPYLLADFEQLLPYQQRHLAEALMPLAKRMGVFDPRVALSDPIGFWRRYWASRHGDYHEAIVRRVVARLARDPSARRIAEVRELDTFALPQLLDVIENAHPSPAPVALETVTRLAARMTNQPWSYQRGETDLALIQKQWQSFWLHNRHRYEAYGGVRQLAAMIEQTRYARWVTELLTKDHFASAGSIGQRLRTRGPMSVLLFALIWLGVSCHAALRAVAAAGRMRPLSAIFLFTIPAVTWCSWLAQLAVPRPWLAAAAALGAGVALAAQRWDLPHFFSREESSREHAEFLSLSWTTSTVIAIELGLELPGLGTETLAALAERDADWLMALILGAAVIVAGARASRLLLASLRPGASAEPLPEHGARS